MNEIKFSFFHSNKGISNLHPQKNIDLNELFRIFQSERLIEYTNAIRSAENDELRDELKKNLPFITPHGTFSIKENSGIEHYNRGFIAFDFDHLEPHEIEDITTKAKQSENVVYSGISPRGKGVKVLMLFNHLFEPENHRKNLLHYSKDILKTIGIEHEPDPRQFTLNQAMFLSHDPNAYYNLHAVATNEPLEPFTPKRENQILNIDIKGHSRIDNFLIGTLRKKVEFLTGTNEGARHSAILNCIQTIGLMKYYSPHLENEFYNSLKQAVIVMYGSEENAISQNAINTLNDIFIKAEFRTLDKIEEIIKDIEQTNEVFHCFCNDTEIEIDSDKIEWNYAKTRLTWSLNGYRLITKEIKENEVKFHFAIYGRVTHGKTERLNLFDFIDIKILPNEEMILNGKIWDGKEQTITFKNEIA